MLAQVAGDPESSRAPDARTDRLDGNHQRVCEDECPSEPESELRAGLRVGRDSTRIVVGGPRDQAGAQTLPQRPARAVVGRFHFSPLRRNGACCQGWKQPMCLRARLARRKLTETRISASRVAVAVQSIAGFAQSAGVPQIAAMAARGGSIPRVGSIDRTTCAKREGLPADRRPFFLWLPAHLTRSMANRTESRGTCPCWFNAAPIGP